jgi:hypothetical protein
VAEDPAADEHQNGTYDRIEEVEHPDRGHRDHEKSVRSMAI